MTTDSTAPPRALTDGCVEQTSAVLALLNLIRRNPQLPAPRIVVEKQHVEYNFPSHLDLQLETASDFEAWRSMLGTDPSGVTLHRSASYVWLAVDGYHANVRVHLSGFNVPVTESMDAAPREIAEVSA